MQKLLRPQIELIAWMRKRQMLAERVAYIEIVQKPVQLAVLLSSSCLQPSVDVRLSLRQKRENRDAAARLTSLMSIRHVIEHAESFAAKALISIRHSNSIHLELIGISRLPTSESDAVLMVLLPAAAMNLLEHRALLHVSVPYGKHRLHFDSGLNLENFWHPTDSRRLV